MRTWAPQPAPGRGRPRTSHRVHVRVIRPTCRPSGQRASSRTRMRTGPMRGHTGPGGAIRLISTPPDPRTPTPHHIPPQHTIESASDENPRASAQVDTINDDDVTTPINDRTDRPSLPQRLTTPTKRTPPTRHIHPTAPTEQPGQELNTTRGRRVHFVQRRDTAGLTPPALTT